MPKKEVEMQPVDSSAVSALGYDSRSRTMYVDWIKGGRYSYYGVSKDLYEQVRSSNSVGETMNYVKRSIRGRKV